MFDFRITFGLYRLVLGVGVGFINDPRLNMSPYRTIWIHFRPNVLELLAKYAWCLWANYFWIFDKCPIASSSHSHEYLTCIASKIAKSYYGRIQFEPKSLKLLNCHVRSRSKTLSERWCTGFTLSPKIIGSWISGFTMGPPSIFAVNILQWRTFCSEHLPQTFAAITCREHSPRTFAVNIWVPGFKMGKWRLNLQEGPRLDAKRH